jgi:hypothetical protein
LATYSRSGLFEKLLPVRGHQYTVERVLGQMSRYDMAKTKSFPRAGRGLHNDSFIGAAGLSRSSYDPGLVGAELHSKKVFLFCVGFFGNVFCPVQNVVARFGMHTVRHIGLIFS